MNVKSTNLGQISTIVWNGKDVQTGIYKKPVMHSIFLGENDVSKDNVIDRKHHGGKDKACYIFSVEHYNYWKKIYPELDWDWGMFGENLTVSGLDEANLFIGDILKVGEAVVQVSQPRQPCFKLGVRFGNQAIVKQFVKYGYSGAYLRIIEKGNVNTGDKLEIIQKQNHQFSVQKIFNLLYTSQMPDKKVIDNILKLDTLAESCKKDLLKHFNASLPG
ncbi:MAG: MOSC domain-containing protein [Bacteroidales bacterium]